MFWFIVGAVVVAGLAVWGWSHYRTQTEDALNKAGSAVDNAVNKAEDLINKK